MARIAGVDLPRDKRVEIGLTYIYGIGRTSASRILADAGVDPNTRVRDLTFAHFSFPTIGSPFMCMNESYRTSKKTLLSFFSQSFFS